MSGLERAFMLSEHRKRVADAQHVINLAVEAGHFEPFYKRVNNRDTWQRLAEAAEDLLAGEYPDLEVRVDVEPGSFEVSLRVTKRRGV